MCKCFNFNTNLLSEMIKKIKEEEYNGVVWIGVNSFFPIIYQFLIDNNINLIAVMDNDPDKQFIIHPLKKYFSSLFPYERKMVTPVHAIPQNNILYLMANSHYEELFYQLKSQNKTLKKEDVFNLYTYHDTTQKKYYSTKEEYLKNYQQITLNQIQKIEFNILKEFRDFCKDNHLRYYLCGGTLIGAIRHNGFIPWDDDIDVYMPYEDYITFINKYKGKYKILDFRTNKNYPLQFAQLVDDSTFLFREMNWIDTAFIMSVFIDIFPLGGYENTPEKIEMQWEKNRNLDGEWWYYYAVKEIDEIYSHDIRYELSNKRHQKSFYESEYVGNVIQTTRHPWALKRTVFDKTRTVTFEGEKFDAPIGYDEYLSYIYGDYMQVPPEYKREKHCFISGLYN